MKLLWTPMMKRYIFKLFIRVSIFVTVLCMYIADKEMLYQLTVQPIWNGIAFMHVLWVGFMLMMLGHIFPPKRLVTMALRKAEPEFHEPADCQ